MSGEESGTEVLVSYVHGGAGMPEGFRQGLTDSAERVSGLLRERGLSVRIIDAAQPNLPPAEALAGASGLIVLGGGDVAPEVYGQAVLVDNLYYVDAAADRFEIELVRRASEAGIPVLGICRGSQVINVAFGGSLVQDLGPGLHNREVVGDPWTDHDVALEAETRVAELFGEERVTVRTGHHQAVDRLGEGLRIAARADDGVVEATEGIDRWIVGLQWHPEEAQGDPIALERFFDGFSAAVREDLLEG